MPPDCGHWPRPPAAVASWLPSLFAIWPLPPLCACVQPRPWPSSRPPPWLSSLRQLLPSWPPLPWPSSRPRLWLFSLLPPWLSSRLRPWLFSPLPLSWPWPLLPWPSPQLLSSLALPFSFSAPAPWHLLLPCARLPPSWPSALPACGLPRPSGPSLPPASARLLFSVFRPRPCGSPLQLPCAWSRRCADAPAAGPARVWRAQRLPCPSAAVQPWAGSASAAGSASPADPGIRCPASPHWRSAPLTRVAWACWSRDRQTGWCRWSDAAGTMQRDNRKYHASHPSPSVHRIRHQTNLRHTGILEGHHQQDHLLVAHSLVTGDDHGGVLVDGQIAHGLLGDVLLHRLGRATGDRLVIRLARLDHVFTVGVDADDEGRLGIFRQLLGFSLRQINLDPLRDHGRHRHEDDEQHQHDVDIGNHVDLGHLLAPDPLIGLHYWSPCWAIWRFRMVENSSMKLA